MPKWFQVGKFGLSIAVDLDLEREHFVSIDVCYAGNRFLVMLFRLETVLL